jgi:peptide chain release factor subunit 1
MERRKEKRSMDIENWKMRKLIKRLNEARGNGTSIISLILPPGDQICRVNRMLTEEYGTATNIKSRVNRLSVLDAITAAQQRLKLYPRTPPNGLVMYCGTVLNEQGKERRVTIDFEPLKPINTSLYMCDNKFHTAALSTLLEEEDVFGFIVMNGDGCLYATVSGNVKNVLYQFGVDLPKKHGRGGQSSVRFARLRMEARHNYTKKVAEFATQFFITNNMPNVRGIGLAGSADFKTELGKADFFDPRLAAVLLQTVDVAYGGQRGLGQAIELSSECLGGVRLFQEKKLLRRFFEEIQRDTGRYCYMVADTIRALEMGAVEVLLVWEQLEIERHEVIDASTNESKTLFLPKDASLDAYIVQESMQLTEWLANHYKDFGTTLEFLNDHTDEGHQFVRGFSGIGGILRWSIGEEEEEYQEEEKEEHALSTFEDTDNMEDLF